MRILIYIGKYEDYALAKLIINRLSSNGVEVVAARDVEVKNLGIPKWDGSQDVDMAMVIGGDGTVLRFIHEITNSISTPPILHIGTGRVNYLSDVSARELPPQVLDKIVKGEYTIEERLTLKAVATDFECTALNEVLVKGVDPGHLINVTIVEDGGEEVMRARMDGVIIATPTGSTAYALAAGGGPAVDSRLAVKLIVPLAPFSRALVPPIVHPYEVPIKVLTSEVAHILCDGIVAQRGGAEIRITPGDRKVRFIRTRQYRMYDRLFRRLFIP
ncbi:NAD(+)/NADH kinase [Vulcanisaeta distributa]|uniref:NAD(+)/NADH kinase n=1 Tax=Vulcanisaeta distributa TaxID=164451 RepID=UPI0006D0D935|nr:NAD(+)/NADH kinase [Vulcanisaeta distributa]